jgi:hypothetical protein
VFVEVRGGVVDYWAGNLWKSIIAATTVEERQNSRQLATFVVMPEPCQEGRE